MCRNARLDALTCLNYRITHFLVAKAGRRINVATAEEVKGWLTGRLPKEWFSGAPEVRMDEDEIWVIGALPDVQAPGGGDAVKAAQEGAIQRFREGTRDERIKIA